MFQRNSLKDLFVKLNFCLTFFSIERIRDFSALCFLRIKKRESKEVLSLPNKKEIKVERCNQSTYKLIKLLTSLLLNKSLIKLDSAKRMKRKILLPVILTVSRLVFLPTHPHRTLHC